MKVIFACAGTGGHINPAIAMAGIILKHEPESNILFIGTENGLENKLVKNAGYEIKHIRTGKILREITLKNITALINAYMGIFDSKKILKEFKPDLIIGTGGYICGPVMKAAKSLKIPYILHESNAFPGVSVKLLAKDARCVMLGFEDAKKRLTPKANTVYTGTPAKFNEEEVRIMGRTASGVRGINLGNSSCIGAEITSDDDVVLIVTERGYGKQTNVREYRTTKRGSKGVKALNITEKNGPIAAFKVVKDNQDLVLMTDAGMIIRMPLNQVSVLGRVTQGIRLINLKDNNKVATISLISEEENTDNEI